MVSPVVNRRRRVVFGVVVYYAVCRDHGWLSSAVGQTCWLGRKQRDRVAREHREMFHGTAAAVTRQQERVMMT